MSNIKLYNADQVRQVLRWPLVNEAIKQSFQAVSNAEGVSNSKKPFANQPPRTITECRGKGSGVLLTMPSFVGNYETSNGEGENNSSMKRDTLACKLVTSFSGNSKLNPPLPSIMANILVFNTETGQLEHIVDGTQITGWRTASASIVATQYLYFDRSNDHANKAINVAIIGTGVQGSSHAMGMCATYNVSNIYLWNRTKSKADNLAVQLRAEHPKVSVHVCDDAATAVADADVICVGTYSPNALVTLDMIKKDDVHINTVGAGQVHFGEVAQDIYDNAQVFIDSWANARIELKDLKATIIGEVGEVIEGAKQVNRKGITIFQSMGMAAQDATVAHAVVEAIKRNDK